MAFIIGNIHPFLAVLFAVLLYMGNMTGFITVLSLFCISVFLIVPCRCYIDSIGRWLIAFTICYLAIGLLTGFIDSLTTLIAHAFPLPFFYCFGGYVVRKSIDKDQILLFIACVILLYSLEIYTSIVQNIFYIGNIVNVSRVFYFGGQESRELTATLVGLTVSLGFAGLPLFVVLKNHKVTRNLYLLIFFFSLLTTIHLVNRTGLVVCVSTMVVTILYYYRNQRINIIIATIIFFIIGIILFKLGIVNQEVITAYSERNEADVMTGGGRTERWLYALDQIFISPLGWAEVGGTTENFVHNMWLDIAKVTGLIPFFLIFVVTLKTLKLIFLLARYKQDSIVAMFVSLNVCFFLSCFVEPVYGGLHLFLYAMIWGMESNYLKRIELK